MTFRRNDTTVKPNSAVTDCSAFVCELPARHNQ